MLPESHVRLGVNIDHVATIRNARGSMYPDPVEAAILAQNEGADGITAHLREDRRHIRDEDIDGLIVQLPLPIHIDSMKITQAINPKKDVDGFHPFNIGRMVLNLPTYIPATPAGIVELLKRYDVDTSGKHCVVIGRSHIVGSPMSILMSRNNKVGNCTVTLAHSKTQNLKEITKSDYFYPSVGIFFASLTSIFFLFPSIDSLKNRQSKSSELRKI